MSYKHQRIGPWPIVDLEATKIVRANNGSAIATGQPLIVCLDTANLGSGKEGFVNCVNTRTTTLAGNSSLSYGIALCPLDQLTEDELPFLLEMSCAVNMTRALMGALDVVGFIGLIDTADVAIGDGWDANNSITDYCILPSDGNGATVAINQQVLIKNIISASVNMDKYLVIGFMIQNSSSSASNLAEIDYMISARYAIEPIAILDKTY